MALRLLSRTIRVMAVCLGLFACGAQQLPGPASGPAPAPGPAHTPRGTGKWVLLRFTAAGPDPVGVQTCPSCGASAPYHAARGEYRIYGHGANRTVWTHTLADPTIRFADAAGPEPEGAMDSAGEGYAAISVPAGVEALAVVPATDLRAARWHVLPVPGRAKFAAQEAPRLQTWQQPAPPGETKALVFVAAGFTLGQQPDFVARVRDCYYFLAGRATAAGLPSPAPWPRYMPLLNVYSIFEPSVAAGAGDPARNNLGCRYGRTPATARLLQCDTRRVAELASIAPGPPERQLVVVLVNAGAQGAYGGQAFPYMTPRYVTVTTVASMRALLLHELAHADAGVWDEYTVTPPRPALPTDPEAPNCQRSPVASRWQYWQAQPPPVGLSGPAAPGCTFTDYYRPSDRCIMRSLNDGALCPVCAEAVLQGIYRDVDNLASPRCPRVNETLVVAYTSVDHYLAINGAFLTGGDAAGARSDAGPVTAEWEFPDGRRAVGATAPFNAAALGPPRDEPYIITLRVTDAARSMRAVPPPTAAAGAFADYHATRHKMVYTTEFRVRVVPRTDAAFRHCTPAELSEKTTADPGLSLNVCPIESLPVAYPKVYCGVCDPGADCSLPGSGQAQLPDNRLDLADVWAGAEPWVLCVTLSLTCAMALFGLGVAMHARRMDAQMVLKMPPRVVWLRRGVLAGSVAVVAAAVAAVAVLVVVYREQPPFRQALIIAGIAACGALYAVHCVCFAGALRWSDRVMLLGSVLVMCVLLVVVCLNIVTCWIATSFSGFKSEMRTAWLQHLAARPDAICAIQSHLQCSGFNLSCAEVHHSECPQDCDVSNSFTEPCYSVAYDVTVQYFKLLTVWTVIVMVLAAISAVACWTLWYWLKGAIQAATEELQRRDGMDPHVPRALAVVRNLSPERQRRLQAEFRKIDRGGTGTMDAAGLTVLFSKVLRVQLTAEQAEAVVSLCDTTGDRRVPLNMFMSLCAHPDLELGHPNVAHLQQQYAAGRLEEFHDLDSDGVGLVGLDRFNAYCKRRYGRAPSAVELSVMTRALGLPDAAALAFPQFVAIVEGLDLQCAHVTPQTTPSPSPNKHAVAQEATPSGSRPACPGCGSPSAAGRYCSHGCYERAQPSGSALAASQCPGCQAPGPGGKYCSYGCYEAHHAQWAAARVRALRAAAAFNRPGAAPDAPFTDLTAPPPLQLAPPTPSVLHTPGSSPIPSPSALRAPLSPPIRGPGGALHPIPSRSPALSRAAGRSHAVLSDRSTPQRLALEPEVYGSGCLPDMSDAGSARPDARGEDLLALLPPHPLGVGELDLYAPADPRPSSSGAGPAQPSPLPGVVL